MSERLRDQTAASDPTLARGARLLRSIRPRDPSPAMFARVQANIRARQRQRRNPAWLTRPAIVALVLLALVASAAASMLVYRIVERISSNRGTGETPAAVEKVPPRGAKSNGVVVSPRPPATPPPGSPVAPPPRPTHTSSPISGRKNGAPRDTSAPVRIRVPSPIKENGPDRSMAAAADPGEAIAHDGTSPLETQLCLDALNALRRDGDARRATAALRFYLHRYPLGALIEEARALLVEANAGARYPGTAALADDYLNRYPNGRYRQAVLRLKQSSMEQ